MDVFHLYIVRRRLVAGPLEGLRDIAKDFHWRQEVTGVEVSPLGEVEQAFGDLGHPIPCQHPLTFSKVPLNLQKQGEIKNLGHWCPLRNWPYTQLNTEAHNGINGVQKWRRKHLLSEAIYVTLMSKPGSNVFCLVDVLKWANMNKRGNWSRRQAFSQKVHSEMTFHIIAHGFMSINTRSQVLYVLSQLFGIILFLTAMEGYRNDLFYLMLQSESGSSYFIPSTLFQWV